MESLKKYIQIDPRQSTNEPTHLLWTQKLIAPYVDSIAGLYWGIFIALIIYLSVHYIVAPALKKSE